ncbi:glycosyltransferase family 4 protein [Fulvivirgaceae bacterium LMO-SS25]
MKKNILILPSWYPTELKPNEGLYFYEQAKILSKNFDVKLIFGETVILSPRKFLVFVLRSVFSLKLTIKKDKNSHRVGFKMPFLWIKNKFINHLVEYWYYKRVFDKICGDWKPDFILLQSAYMKAKTANKLSKKIGVPLIIHEHQIPFNYSFQYDIVGINDIIKSNTDFLCVSEYQGFLFQLLNLRNEFKLLPNYIDTKNLLLIKENIPHSALNYISFVSYDWYIKDNDTFLKAIQFLIDKLGYTNFKVRFIGGSLNPGQKEDPYMSLPEKYGISDYFDVLGRQTKEDTLKLIASSKVLVSTSLSETHGLVIREALALGVPVISTKNGGADSLFSEEGIGILCEKKDFKSIAKGIKEILTNRFYFDEERAFSVVNDECGEEVFLNKFSKITERFN